MYTLLQFIFLAIFCPKYKLTKNTPKVNNKINKILSETTRHICLYIFFIYVLTIRYNKNMYLKEILLTLKAATNQHNYSNAQTLTF